MKKNWKRLATNIELVAIAVVVVNVSACTKNHYTIVFWWTSLSRGEGAILFMSSINFSKMKHLSVAGWQPFYGFIRQTKSFFNTDDALFFGLRRKVLWYFFSPCWNLWGQTTQQYNWKSLSFFYKLLIYKSTSLYFIISFYGGYQQRLKTRTTFK